jgi:Flp pilus assembly protein TadG
VLPAVLVLAMALVQIGLVVRDQVRVTHAAREGARAAAVSPDPSAARGAVDRNAGLARDRLEVTTAGRAGTGSHVTVTVTYVVVTDLPLIGPLVPDLSLTGQATMRVEQ